MKEVTIEYKVPQGDTIKLTPATVRNYLVNGDGNLTDQEVVAFLQLCRYRRLNPFLKEAHLIKYGNAPATMVVGRDVFTKRAAAHAAYDGIDSGLHVRSEDGSVIQRTGSFRLPEEEIVGAWARVFRKDWSHPTEVHVAFSEYVGKKKNGETNRQWSEKPATMILKVAETQALRKAFPDEFSGLYDESENVPLHEQARDVTPPMEERQDDGLAELKEALLSSVDEMVAAGLLTDKQSESARETIERSTSEKALQAMLDNYNRQLDARENQEPPEEGDY